MMTPVTLPLNKLTEPVRSSEQLSSPSENKLKIEPDFSEGKHLAKRDVKSWPDYGDPRVYEGMFENAVLQSVTLLREQRLNAQTLIHFFEDKRHEIELYRNGEHSKPYRHHFGVRRTEGVDLRQTLTSITNSNCYDYASKRAVGLQYSDSFENKLSGHVERFLKRQVYSYMDKKDKYRYGVVIGNAGNEKIYLTQYIYLKGVERSLIQIDFFGRDKSDGQEESALWYHTDVDQISKVMSYIEGLVEKAIDGDLKMIPKIHWWYVHLAPTKRGSGGIAEMIVNALCRLHNIDLPPWKEGIAPSVEVLLEPDEEKFCSSYHQLFESDQEKLKISFKTED